MRVHIARVADNKTKDMFNLIRVKKMSEVKTKKYYYHLEPWGTIDSREAVELIFESYYRVDFLE